MKFNDTKIHASYAVYHIHIQCYSLCSAQNISRITINIHHYIRYWLYAIVSDRIYGVKMTVCDWTENITKSVFFTSSSLKFYATRIIDLSNDLVDIIAILEDANWLNFRWCQQSGPIQLFARFGYAFIRLTALTRYAVYHITCVLCV